MNSQMPRTRKNAQARWICFLLFFAVLAIHAEAVAQSSSPAGLPQEVIVEGQVIGRRVPVQAGETCAQCNRPVGAADVAYRVRGQRVALHAREVESNLRAQLERLVAQLQPRGAFIGGAGEKIGLSSIWFYAGVYVLLGLIFGAIAAHRALNLGHSAMSWFLVGFLLTLPGYLYLLTRPKREVQAPSGIPAGLRKIAATYAPEACAACGAENHPSAEQCAGCGAKLAPQVVSEVTRAGVH